MPGSLSSALQQMYFGFGVSFEHELPLHAGREAGAAAAAQARRLHQLDDVTGFMPSDFFSPVAPWCFSEEVEGVAVRLADVFRKRGAGAAGFHF